MSIDLESLAMLGEFVGGFFVVVSLVYLAFQVRQNTVSIRNENYGRALDRLSTLQSNLSADRELNRIVTVGSLDTGKLTRSERTRFSWAMYELLGGAEFVFHQAQSDAIAEEVWRRWRATLAWWVSNPGIQEWWRARPSPFSASFEAEVEELIRDRPVDSDAVARWERWVIGDPEDGGSGGPETGAAPADGAAPDRAS